MKNLILYSTKYGSVKRSAEILSSKLKDKTEIFDLKRDKIPDIEEYETIILGGSIYMGKIQSEMRNFIARNLQTLMKKRIGLFINCSAKGEQGTKQFDDAYQKELREIALAKGFFGDELKWSKCSFFDKLILRFVKQAKADFSHLDESEIGRFAQKINKRS